MLGVRGGIGQISLSLREKVVVMVGLGCGIVFSLDLVCGGRVFGEVRYE